MKTRVLRLLIVDDEPMVRASLTSSLSQRTDIAVTEAASGDEAIEKIKVEDYDLALLDLRLPFATEGLDVLAEIKRIKPQTGVMMMNDYGDGSKTVEAMKLGAMDFIPKGPGFEPIVEFKIDKFLRTAQLISFRESLIRTMYEDSRRLKDAQGKGEALGVLLGSLLASIGFIEISRDLNTEAEEIDLVFRNESYDWKWEHESKIILVECKNWHSQRVGKNEFVLFKEKIENRAGRCKLGFLVCTERFAGTIEKEMLRSSKSELLVAPIDGDDLRQLVEAQNRSQALRGFVDRALLI